MIISQHGVREEFTAASSELPVWLLVDLYYALNQCEEEERVIYTIEAHREEEIRKKREELKEYVRSKIERFGLDELLVVKISGRAERSTVHIYGKDGVYLLEEDGEEFGYVDTEKERFVILSAALYVLR